MLCNAAWQQTAHWINQPFGYAAAASTGLMFGTQARRSGNRLGLIRGSFLTLHPD
jgi:hypothetical protein